MRLRILSAAILSASASLPLAAQSGPDNDPAQAAGYVENYFHYTSFDSINQFNGQLTVSVPIGPVYRIGPELTFQAALTYSGRVTEPGNPTDETNPNYEPVVGDPALGVGWTFTAGKIACGALSTSRTPRTPCFVRPDGAQIDFEMPTGAAVYTTSDASSYRLVHNGSPPNDSWTLWDGDGNRSEFTWRVVGYDDDPDVAPGYARDFGRGRDGYYLTSVRDPFGNGLSVAYAADGTTPCPFVCALPTSMRCAGPSTRSWIPATFTIQRVGEAAQPVALVRADPLRKRIAAIELRTFAAGAAQFSTWTLAYGTAPLRGRSSSLYCVPTALTTLTGIALPAGTNASGYAFDYYGGGFAEGHLRSLRLPTGATAYYDYGNYHFYRGRRALLSENDLCNVQPPPPRQGVRRSAVYTDSGAPGNAPAAAPPAFDPFVATSAPCLPGQESRQSEQTHVGVLRRTVAGPGLPTAATDYTQYSFPFGENGDSQAQSLTVALLPPDADGRRRAEATLFWAAKEVVDPDQLSRPGDRVGADLRRSIYEADPNPPLTVLPTAPLCGGPSDSLCPKHSIRTVQRVFAYGGEAAIDGTNRRVKSERTYYGAISSPDAAAADLCPACLQHRVTWSLAAGKTWEGNGRHYDVEDHAGSLGNDARRITTVWAPNPTANQWNLYTRRTDLATSIPAPGSPTGVRNALDRYFFYDPATGFLESEIAFDAPTSRIRMECRYRDPAGNASDSVRRTAVWTGGFAADPCPAPAAGDPLGNYPTGTIGVNGDSFGQRNQYAGGVLASRRWLRDKTPLSWFAYRSSPDSATGWIGRSYDSAGLPTAFTYDALGRVTLVWPAAQAPTGIAYDSPTQTTVARNGADDASWERFLYDGLGRKLRQIRRLPSGYSVRVTAYDAAGHERFVSEWAACASPASDCLSAAPPGTALSNFDPFGRPQRAVGADGSVTTTSFTDNVTPYSDTRKAVTIANVGCVWNGTSCAGGAPSTSAYRYDAFGRVTTALEPGGDLTTYTYDVAGKLVGVFQGAQTRSFRYDALGFLLMETTPEAGTVDYRTTSGTMTYSNWGGLGNLLGRREGGGAISRSYRYDAAGRLLCEVVGAFSAGQSCDSPGVNLYVRNSYDGEGFAGGSFAAGKLTQRVGYNRTLSPAFSVRQQFTYSDPGGRLSQESTSILDAAGAVVSSATQGWGYDSLGHIATHTRQRAAGPLTLTSTRRYGLVTAISASTGQIVVSSAQYGPAGALLSWTGGNGVTTAIAPDPSLLPRPSRISTFNAVATAAGGNFDTGPYRYDGAGNIVATGADVFRYDARSRLTSASFPGIGTQTFPYDRYGNLLSDGTRTFCSGSCSGNRLPAPFSYDARGNLTAAGTAETLTYDDLSRQVRQQSPGADWRYLYDGAGERVAKLPAGGAATYTYRDEGSRIATEYVGATLVRDNVFLGELLVASYVSSTLGGTPGWQWYHSDHLGTPRLVTDAARRVVESRKYRPYGEGVPSNAGTLQKLRFCAMERDSEDSRYNDHARMFDAAVGRFTSPDVLGGRPEDPQSWNRYAYVQGKPMTYVDPDGRDGRAAAMLEMDIQDLAAHRITQDEYFERINARGAGALVALPLLFGGMALLAESVGPGAILLGETMSSRVLPLAEKIGAETFSVRARLTTNELLQKNLSWLQGQIDRGARILDLGMNLERKLGSTFYRAEVALLEKNGFVRRFARFVMVNGQRAILWKWVKE